MSICVPSDERVGHGSAMVEISRMASAEWLQASEACPHVVKAQTISAGLHRLQWESTRQNGGARAPHAQTRDGRGIFAFRRQTVGACNDSHAKARRDRTEAAILLAWKPSST